jgi:hypothetical protein
VTFNDERETIVNLKNLITATRGVLNVVDVKKFTNASMFDIVPLCRSGLMSRDD